MKKIQAQFYMSEFYFKPPWPYFSVLSRPKIAIFIAQNGLLTSWAGVDFKKRERSCQSCVCAALIYKQVSFHSWPHTHNYGNSSPAFCWNWCLLKMWTCNLGSIFIFLQELIRLFIRLGTRKLFFEGVELS